MRQLLRKLRIWTNLNSSRFNRRSRGAPLLTVRRQWLEFGSDNCHSRILPGPTGLTRICIEELILRRLNNALCGVFNRRSEIDAATELSTAARASCPARRRSRRYRASCRCWPDSAGPMPLRPHREETRGTRRLDPGVSADFWINPMNQHYATRLRNLRQAPRCAAKTRAGGSCQCPAMRGGTRCRLHGGLSPGAPCGAKNGNFKNGDWTAEAIEERKWLRSLVQSFAKTGRTE